ncbi:type II toxin-antitoxin system VapC family toxin [Chlorogloeopsis sp. ULAP02]|uniref:type II toxin-antitoxin system VapC family toxin n=1 Tax=Chlorogloeopsis TaxID=1123 RepID=UPI000F8F02AC
MEGGSQYQKTLTLPYRKTSLEIRAPHALQAATLPLHHRDPFDRMLIAQAQLEDMVILSADSMFNQYDVSMLWAANS